MGRKDDADKLTEGMPAPVKEQIADKINKLDSLDSDITQLPARVQCYRRIIQCFKESLASYYARWPERALDERGKDNEEKAIRDVENVLHILDKYDIEYRPNNWKTGGLKT